MMKPSVLGKIKSSGIMRPRESELEHDSHVHSFNGNDEIIMAQINESKYDLFKGFEKQHRILIKLNLNTADPYPASTDPFILEGLLDILLSMGMKNILVGDCSSNSALPTRRTLKAVGLFDVIKNKAKAVFFDKGKWISVPIPGKYLKSVTIPKIVYEVDKIIYLANLKTHRYADFSMSMKLAVGFMHPLERYELHRDFLHEKTVEVSLSVKPDLIFLDARKPFITLGPEKGDTAIGNQIFAGRNLLSVDLKGYELLYKLKMDNNCIETFKKNPYEMRQFKHAADILNGGETL